MPDDRQRLINALMGPMSERLMTETINPSQNPRGLDVPLSPSGGAEAFGDLMPQKRLSPYERLMGFLQPSAGDQVSLAMNLLGGPGRVPGIRAFHGSPHKFDRFDLSKIGTGEGAQAYGHGLYFAEKEGVAKAYRDQLAANKPGHMYEVNIRANPERFLDWDAPTLRQSPSVQSAIDQVTGIGGAIRGMSGEQVVRTFGGKDLPAFSQTLREAGIPGIKYLDQGSRSAGEGSRNYVVFDDSIIDILKRYGLMGSAAAGPIAQALMEPRQGQ